MAHMHPSLDCIMENGERIRKKSIGWCPNSEMIRMLLWKK